MKWRTKMENWRNIITVIHSPAERRGIISKVFHKDSQKRMRQVYINNVTLKFSLMQSYIARPITAGLAIYVLSNAVRKSLQQSLLQLWDLLIKHYQVRRLIISSVSRNQHHCFSKLTAVPSVQCNHKMVNNRVQSFK